jgi:hypothetical protein
MEAGSIATTVRRQRLILLALGLAFVLGCRLVLYVWMPDRTGDFDLLYDSALRLIRGEKPYSSGTQALPCPLPAVLLAVPFTAIPPELARPIFDILVGWALVYALWKYRGSYALLALISGPYVFALANGGTTPLIVAASLVPPLGFLLAIRPTTGAALWTARPSWMTLLAVGLVLALSLMIRPSWPQEWWMALPADNGEWMPPILRPLGFVLLLAAIRWRLPEGRLLFAMALVPQTALPYELISLALVPANRREMMIYVAGSWIAVAAAVGPLHLSGSSGEWTLTGWTVTFAAGYLPMLYLVFRRRTETPRIVRERRRAHRIADEELETGVTTDGAGGVVATVTHLRTKLSATETGPTRELAERKAHDKLAAIMARTSRLRKLA